VVVLGELDGAMARVIQLNGRARIYISTRVVDPGRSILAGARDPLRYAARILAPVYAMSREFRVSVLAAAMRYVELTAERCALVYSEGHVRWCKRSATFAAWIPRGRAVDPSSAAFDFFDRGVIDGASRVASASASAWLARNVSDSSLTSIVEHPTVVPELGAVFSLLWVTPDGHVMAAALPPHRAAL